MGPMLVAMAVGTFFITAVIAAFVSLFPLAYAVCCLRRKQFFQLAAILLIGLIFGLASLLLGVIMMFNVVGGTVMQNPLLGGASWFVIGFAGPALATVGICFIGEKMSFLRRKEPH
jgi:hypothetical protein